jgi:hypothetical protein
MRRKFELLMKDFWHTLDHPGRDEVDLRVLVWGLNRFDQELLSDVGKVRQVLQFIQAIRSSSGPGRQRVEEGLLETLRYVASQGAERLARAKCPRLPGFEAADKIPVKLQPVLEVLRELHDFALASFQFKRPRDSFGGTRRGLAFGILRNVGRAVDLPEVVRMAREASTKTQSIEGRDAADFLEEYFLGRSLSPEVAPNWVTND